MNVQTINFLNKLKNYSLYGKQKVIFSYNKNKLQFLEILYQEGLIQSFSFCLHLTVYLHLSKVCLQYLKILSSPANSKYFKLNQINRFKSIKRTLIFSTNQGLLTLHNCRKHKVGGTLLFLC